MRSTALRFGGDSRLWLSAFAAGTVGSLALVGATASATVTAAAAATTASATAAATAAAATAASGGGVPTAALCAFSLPAYGAGLAGGAAHLAWQLRTVDFDSRADCLRKFQSNHHFGALIFAALVAGRLLATSAEEEPASPDSPGGGGVEKGGREGEAPAGWRAPGGTMYAWLRERRK